MEKIDYKLKLEIAKDIENILNQSYYLKIKGVTGVSTQLLAYKIAEYVLANFNLKRKKEWYAEQDLDERIRQLKQELAITYSYKKKEASNGRTL